MSGDFVSTRTVALMAVSVADLDKPVAVRLSLFDERTLHVVAWSKADDGGLLLVLDADHDHFPVGRKLCDNSTAQRTATEHKARGGWPHPADVIGREVQS